MSYVIQNFSKYNQSLILTPRFKIFFSWKFINFFYFFFKINYKINNFSYLISFLPFFFSKGLFNFFNKLTLKLYRNYTNKLNNTILYANYKNLNNNLNSNKFVKNSIRLNNFFFFNIYFLSIKLINAKLIKTYFKNIFFSFFFFYQTYDYSLIQNLIFI